MKRTQPVKRRVRLGYYFYKSETNRSSGERRANCETIIVFVTIVVGLKNGNRNFEMVGNGLGILSFANDISFRAVFSLASKANFLR